MLHHGAERHGAEHRQIVVRKLAIHLENNVSIASLPELLTNPVAIAA